MRFRAGLIQGKVIEKGIERGRNQTYNLLIKSQITTIAHSLRKPHSIKNLQSLAHTEECLQMLEMLAMFSNVQPQ